MMDGVMHLVTAGVKKNNCGVVCCLKKPWFLETRSRPLWLQSSPVRVLSRNFLPDGQSDIDFYHKFFDTFCWTEGRRCALSHHRTVVSCCLIERRVRQRKVEHAHD